MFLLFICTGMDELFLQKDYFGSYINKLTYKMVKIWFPLEVPNLYVITSPFDSMTTQTLFNIFLFWLNYDPTLLPHIRSTTSFEPVYTCNFRHLKLSVHVCNASSFMELLFATCGLLFPWLFEDGSGFAMPKDFLNNQPINTHEA